MDCVELELISIFFYFILCFILCFLFFPKNGTTSTTTSKSTLGKEFCNEYDLDKDGFMMFEPTGISKAAQNTNTNTTNQKEDEDGGGEEEFDLDQHRKQHKSALLSKTVTAVNFQSSIFIIFTSQNSQCLCIEISYGTYK